MDKKYVLTDATIEIEGHKLHRIKAVRDFEYRYGNNKVLRVTAGQLGGFIEKESNLSHASACWIRKGVAVYGNARVEDNSIIGGCSLIKDASILGDSIIKDSVIIGRHAPAHLSMKNPSTIIKSSKIQGTILDSRKIFNDDSCLVQVHNSIICGLNFSARKGEIFRIKEAELKMFDCSFDASYRFINEMTPDSITLIRGVWSGSD